MAKGTEGFTLRASLCLLSRSSFGDLADNHLALESL